MRKKGKPVKKIKPPPVMSTDRTTDRTITGNEKVKKFLGSELGHPPPNSMEWTMYSEGRSPMSYASSSADDGGASSSSFDNNSITSCHEREFSRPGADGTNKSNHSEVEKRRRRKINSLIDELACLVPTGCSSNRKVDKLTVLKVAVQHLRILRLKTEQGSSVSSRYKPAHMDEKDMERLLENATKGFLFVISTDRLQILHVSDKVKEILNFAPADLIGKRLYDVVHAKDVTMLKEQLTSVQAVGSTNSPLFLGNKTEGDSKESSNKTLFRRSFFCRFRKKVELNDRGKEVDISNVVKKPRAEAFSLTDGDMSGYSIIHCTGFLKSILPVGKPVTNEAELSTCCYFHGVGKSVEVLSEAPDLSAMLTSEEPLEFTCRCSSSGKWLQIDPGMVRILGYLPQDLIGQNCYKYIYVHDVHILQKEMEEVTKKKSFETVTSEPFRMLSRNDCLIPVVASLFNFQNPLTKEIEYIVQKTTVVK